MAIVHRLKHACLGDRGVVVIDGDQQAVRLVRRPTGGEEEAPELREGTADDILRGFLSLTRGR